MRVLRVSGYFLCALMELGGRDEDGRGICWSGRQAGMKFPVDLLADVSQAELELSAHGYMNELLYSNPDSPEHLTLSDSTQVTIDISSVGFIPLYGSSDKQRILALFSPGDPLTAVALYLLERWWTVDDILKTADPTRDGVVEVKAVGERIVLYILNRVIYRAKEMRSDELPFLCHGEKDHAKILWNNGEAVGFYSIKVPGSLCNSFLTRHYQLPVMDSIFVRKGQRGKGFGLQMLENFVLSFKDDWLGLRYPLSKSMYKVCEKYLCKYPGDADLLWEVEGIGGPNQRTNISSKIQAMSLSAVSKSLSFTEESLEITDVTENDVAMETITTQMKESQSMECTVEIVEEMTVLRTTKKADVPFATRGRSGGSKERNLGEKIREDKSEKLIRIEDIEAETPSDDHVTAQQKTETHDVTEVVQTEGMFSVAPENKGEDVGTSQDLEEADLTSPHMTEEPQDEDDCTQDVSNTSHDAQITVENMASEIERAEEEYQKEDCAALVVSEEVLEAHTEADILNKVIEGTQIEIIEEKLKETVTQHKLSLSSHVTSEGGESGKTERTVVKAIKTVQSEIPRRRSQRHGKPEERETEETITKDGKRVLRRRTVITSPTPKRKYTHSKKIYEEIEKEVAEENEVSTTEIVEELAVTEGEELEEIASINEDVVGMEKLREGGKQQLEEGQLTNEEQTEKHEAPGMEDTVPKRSSTEFSDTAETAVDKMVTDESEKEQKGEEVETSVIQDKEDVSEDGIEEPPVVQRRALRGRYKVTPKHKPTKHNKRHQKQGEESTDEADLEAGGSAIDIKADECAPEKQMGDHQQVEQEDTFDKTEKELSTKDLPVVEESKIQGAEEAAEDIPSTEVNVEECKEVQEDKEAEAVSMMEANKEPDTVALASEIIPDKVLDEISMPVAEEPQKTDISSEIPKLQEATVVLVDLKTTGHDLSLKETEERECTAPDEEQMEVPSCIAEEQTSVREILVLKEDNGEKQDNSKEKFVDAAEEGDSVEKEGLEDSSDKYKEESADGEKSEADETPFIETRVLRSGRKTVKASNQQQEEDKIEEAITEKREAESGTVEVEGEMEIMTIPLDEESAVLEISADIDTDIAVADVTEENCSPAEVDKEMSLEEEEEEAPIVTRALRSGTKTAATTPRHKTIRSGMQVDEQDTENSGEEQPTVTTRTLRQGEISAPATPKGKSGRTHKQIQGEVLKGTKESKIVEETREEEEAVKGAAEEKTEKQQEGQTEEEIEHVKEEAVFEKEKKLKTEIDVEEGKAVTEKGQDVVEDQSEAIYKTFAENEVEVSGGECDERKAVLEGEEVELPPVMVTRSLRSGGKTAKAPPINRSRRSKELQKEEEGPKKSVEVAEVGEEERLPSVKETPTEGDEGIAPEMDETEVENEGPTADVEKGPSIVSEKEEITAGAKADDLVQGESDIPLPKPATNSAILTPGEEERMASAEEEQKKNEKLVEEEGCGDKVEDAVTIQDRGEGRADETAKEDEVKSVDEEEEEPTVTETRTQRSRKQAVKATPRVKLAKCKQKKGEAEKEDTFEIGEEKLQQGEEKGEEESTTVEEKEAKEEEEQAEEQQQVADQEKGERLQGKDAIQQAENAEPEVSEEKVDTLAEETVILSEEGQAGSTGTTAEEDTEAPTEESANEEKISDNVAEEAATTKDTLEEEQSTSISEVALLTTEDDKAEDVSEVKETPVIEARLLRSGKKAVRATARSKTTKTDEKEDEATGDEPAVETRFLRKGRRSTAVTPRAKSKRAHTQYETEEEGGNETTPAEEMQGEEIKEVPEEVAEKEKDEDEAAREKAENTEQEVEMKKVEPVVEESVTDQEAVAESQSAVSETCANGQEVTPIEESAEEVTNTGEEKVTNDEEAPAVEPRVLRRGGKTAKATPRFKIRKSQQEESELERTVVEKSSDTDEAAVETRILRKGRRSGPATPRHKSKRARRLCRPEEEGEEETAPAEETEGEEEETGQELPEEKGEKAGEEGNCMEMGVQQDKDIEDEVVSVSGGELPVGEAEQVRDASTEEAAVVEEEDNRTENSEHEKTEDVLQSTDDSPKSSNMRSVESTNEKVTVQNLALDTDEEVENAGVSQEDEEDEQNMSEEEVEPIVIGKRVLRGRTVPPITPRSKTKRRSAKVQKSEESLSDEEKSPKSAHKTSFLKRKSTEVTPTRKSKHHSIV
uniref:trichohyalin-like n=1 Tax=Scatophagus argus TaxID=75038 RepID=UPI001ED846D3|nr:trichohyalin-like [Scatophagus argus]